MTTKQELLAIARSLQAGADERVGELVAAIEALPEAGGAPQDVLDELRHLARTMLSHLDAVEQNAGATRKTVQDLQAALGRLEPKNGNGGGNGNGPTRPEVRVRPGESLGKAHAAAEKARVILEGPRVFKSGAILQPKAGQTIEAPERNVWFDGEGTRTRAIELGAKDVQIIGLGIRNYRPEQYQKAAIEPRDFNHPDEADGFELIDCRVEDIAHGRALSGVMNMRVKGCTILRIGAVGIGGDYGGAVVEDGEIGFCNLAGHSTWTEAACIKSTGGLGFNKGNVYRRLELHDCDGRGGIWIDWDVIDALIEECDIWNTSREGLAIEAASHIRLLNNRLALCATSQQGMWDGVVMFQNSKDCEATGNLVVVEDGYAFSVGFQRRGQGSTPPQQQGRHHVGRFDGVRDGMTDNHLVLLGGDAMGFSWLFDNATSTAPKVDGWTKQDAFNSHTWGPNKWSLGPSASRHPFDPKGGVTNYQDAWEAVPADFRKLIGKAP